MTESVADPAIPAVVFTLRTRLFAFEQHGAATLLPWLQRYAGASSVPGLPQWSLGLLNVRGTVQMAVDLGCLLGLGPSVTGPESRLIFLEQGPVQLGLLVDTEVGVRYLQGCGEPAPGEHLPFVFGTATQEGRRLLVLDGAAILRYVADQLGKTTQVP